jgi:hypothetical protein
MREIQRVARAWAGFARRDARTGAGGENRLLAIESITIVERTSSSTPGLVGVERGGVASEAFGAVRS